MCLCCCTKSRCCVQPSGSNMTLSARMSLDGFLTSFRGEVTDGLNTSGVPLLGGRDERKLAKRCHRSLQHRGPLRCTKINGSSPRSDGMVRPRGQEVLE